MLARAKRVTCVNARNSKSDLRCRKKGVFARVMTRVRFLKRPMRGSRPACVALISRVKTIADFENLLISVAPSGVRPSFVRVCINGTLGLLSNSQHPNLVVLADFCVGLGRSSLPPAQWRARSGLLPTATAATSMKSKAPNCPTTGKLKRPGRPGNGFEQTPLLTAQDVSCVLLPSMNHYETISRRYHLQ